MWFMYVLYVQRIAPRLLSIVAEPGGHRPLKSHCTKEPPSSMYFHQIIHLLQYVGILYERHNSRADQEHNMAGDQITKIHFIQ